MYLVFVVDEGIVKESDLYAFKWDAESREKELREKYIDSQIEIRPIVVQYRED